MEPWTIVLSFWLTTWLMLIWRTYSISMRLIEKGQKDTLVTQYRLVHFIIYVVGILILTPFIWKVAIFEKPRKKWVLAYVGEILGKKE